MGFSDFLNDLVDGVKQQQNPFTTVGKAFSYLGTRPIEDAVPGPSLVTWWWGLLFLPVLIAVFPVLLTYAAINGAVTAASAVFGSLFK